MALKVGINGFGRIGRNIMRAALAHHDVDIVAVNDITDAATLAHLLKYDSVLGNLSVPVAASGDVITVGSDQFTVLSVKDPALLPWKDLGVDFVFECTGKFTKRDDAAKHIAAGAKKVVVTAPAMLIAPAPPLISTSPAPPSTVPASSTIAKATSMPSGTTGGTPTPRTAAGSPTSTWRSRTMPRRRGPRSGRSAVSSPDGPRSNRT